MRHNLIHSAVLHSPIRFVKDEMGEHTLLCRRKMLLHTLILATVSFSATVAKVEKAPLNVIEVKTPAEFVLKIKTDFTPQDIVDFNEAVSRKARSQSAGDAEAQVRVNSFAKFWENGKVTAELGLVDIDSFVRCDQNLVKILYPSFLLIGAGYLDKPETVICDPDKDYFLLMHDKPVVFDKSIKVKALNSNGSLGKESEFLFLNSILLSHKTKAKQEVFFSIAVYERKVVEQTDWVLVLNIVAKLCTIISIICIMLIPEKSPRKRRTWKPVGQGSSTLRPENKVHVSYNLYSSTKFHAAGDPPAPSEGRTLQEKEPFPQAP